MADALSRMPMINELSFTQFSSDLLESLKGKCQVDPTYSRIWESIENGDPNERASIKGTLDPADQPLDLISYQFQCAVKYSPTSGMSLEPVAIGCS